jgi:phage terminase small subunit
MGARGPLPKATAIITPADPLPQPPRWLPDGPAEIWRELAPELHGSGRLGAWNGEVFAAYVQTAFELRRLAVEVDAGPLTDRGPHGPVASGNVAVALKLRATLGTLASKLGLDARGGTPPASNRTPSALDQWRARHRRLAE